jgi:hypothetical protein
MHAVPLAKLGHIYSSIAQSIYAVLGSKRHHGGDPARPEKSQAQGALCPLSE